jgi:hypothetical protein
MTLPNLIGCGAGKSGTTSLYYYLSQHPQIYMAAVKEIHYFSRHYHEGSGWYEKYFANGNDVAIVGEFSTSYMLDTAVPKRLSDLIPDASLFFVFRDPIERAYSNYWFSVSLGTQDRKQSFSDAIRSKSGFTKYIESGFYYQHLTRFLNYFPPEQIFVMITEELKKDPIKQMSSCYEYLGVDKAFLPDVSQQYNVTVTTQSNWLGSAYAAWMMTKKQTKPLFKRFPVELRRALARIEKSAVKQVMSDKRPIMANEDRSFLTEIFAEQNVLLTEFIGRDLPYWQ